MLEAVEEPFNEISGLVAVPINRARGLTVAARRDDGLSPRVFDSLNQAVTVAALVGNDRSSLETLDQCGPLRDVRDVSCSQNQADRIAQRIDTGVDLGGQSAA